MYAPVAKSPIAEIGKAGTTLWINDPHRPISAGLSAMRNWSDAKVTSDAVAMARISDARPSGRRAWRRSARRHAASGRRSGRLRAEVALEECARLRIASHEFAEEPLGIVAVPAR